MNVLTKKSITMENQTLIIESLAFEKEHIFFTLSDRRIVGIPIDWIPEFKQAKEEEISSWRFIENGGGIHWPKLDVDISAGSLLLYSPLKSKSNFVEQHDELLATA